jgi:hypothetical protein
MFSKGNDHNPYLAWFLHWKTDETCSTRTRSESLVHLFSIASARPTLPPHKRESFSSSIYLLLRATDGCKSTWANCQVAHLKRAWNHYLNHNESSRQVLALGTDWSSICFELRPEAANFPKVDEDARRRCDVRFRTLPQPGLDDTFDQLSGRTEGPVSSPAFRDTRPTRRGRASSPPYFEQPNQSSPTSVLLRSDEPGSETAVLSPSVDFRVVTPGAAPADDPTIWNQIEQASARAKVRLEVLGQRESSLLAQFEEIGRELDRLEHQKMLREQAATREETKTRRRAYADILGKLTRALDSVSRDDASWVELTQELQDLGIEPIGRVGQVVELAPGYEKQFDLGARIELAPGAGVEVLSSGWSWEDQTLVRARVRPVRGGAP